MIALDSPILVALILSSGGFLTAVASGVIVWLSGRKTLADRATAAAQNDASVVEKTHGVLGRTIDWQDSELTELRAEVRHLRAEVRRLEKEQRGE